MKQITQKEFIKLLEEKEKNATNIEERLRIQATSKDDLDTAKRCFGEARAYQDLMCYLNSVEIVPEEQIVTTIPKAESLRNDRFREFVDGETTLTIDAKAISSIKVNKIDLNIQINENGNYGFEKFFKSEDEATAYYNDLLAWVKYWKRN